MYLTVRHNPERFTQAGSITDQLEISAAGLGIVVERIDDLPAPEIVLGGQGTHVVYPVTMPLVRQIYSRKACADAATQSVTLVWSG